MTKFYEYDRCLFYATGQLESLVTTARALGIDGLADFKAQHPSNGFILSPVEKQEQVTDLSMSLAQEKSENNSNGAHQVWSLNNL